MKEIKNVFKPEKRPFHKVDFSVATQIKLEDAELKALLDAGEYLHAGKLLTTKSATANDTIISNPTAGASVTVADGKAMGVLAHDIQVEAGVKDYSAGVVISGVVYEDVMKLANANTATTSDNMEALAKQGLLFYNVKTLKA